MLYFENLRGVKEDEYLRDGITEDIITELSKIEGAERSSRARPCSPFRDQPVTAAAGRPAARRGVRARAAACGAPATGCGSPPSWSTRRPDFPVWSERYDREMEDVFEVQDEIARKIAEALRITLSPQEQEVLAAKPTENLAGLRPLPAGPQLRAPADAPGPRVRAPDVRERGRRSTRTSRSPTPRSPTSAPIYYGHEPEDVPGSTRARAAAERAIALDPRCRKSLVAQAWILYAKRRSTTT